MIFLPPETQLYLLLYGDEGCFYEFFIESWEYGNNKIVTLVFHQSR